MATVVGFRDRQSGEIRSVKVGWSWTLFLFGPVLGIPLFMRGLHSPGFAVIGLNALCALLPLMVDGSDNIARGAAIGLAIVLGLHGNKMTAQHYLKHGWDWADPESEAAAYAQAKWELA